MLKRKEKLTNEKKLIIISTIMFGVLGITALILGFGLTNGWNTVLAWFSSRWAIYVYIGVALLAFLVVFLVFKTKMEK